MNKLASIMFRDIIKNETVEFTGYY